MNGLYSIELDADRYEDTRALMAELYAEETARAAALHAFLTRHGVPSAHGYHDHFVGTLLGRDLTSLVGLTDAEEARVRRAVEALVAGRALLAAQTLAEAAD